MFCFCVYYLTLLTILTHILAKLLKLIITLMLSFDYSLFNLLQFLLLVLLLFFSFNCWWWNVQSWCFWWSLLTLSSIKSINLRCIWYLFILNHLYISLLALFRPFWELGSLLNGSKSNITHIIFLFIFILIAALFLILLLNFKILENLLQYIWLFLFQGLFCKFYSFLEIL